MRQKDKEEICEDKERKGKGKEVLKKKGRNERVLKIKKKLEQTKENGSRKDE